MADIVTSGSVPAGTQFTWKDMGDGTFAPTWDIRKTTSGGNDIVVSGGLPASLVVRYADQGDGTHALVYAAGG